MLFGCANLPVKPYAETLAVPSESARFGGTQFDGVYEGAIQITSAAPEIPSDWCQPAGNRILLRVTNDSVNSSLTYANARRTQTFSIPVASDGSFSGVGSMNAAMSGQVSGNQISGTIVGEGCNSSFSARRS